MAKSMRLGGDDAVNEKTEIAQMHQGNMNVIARVVDKHGAVRSDAVVRVIDGDGELRALTDEAHADLYFITVAGANSGANLRFIVSVDGMEQVIMEPCSIVTMLSWAVLTNLSSSIWLLPQVLALSRRMRIVQKQRMT